MKHHCATTALRQLSDGLSIKFIKPCSGEPLVQFDSLIAAIGSKEDFEHLFLNDFTQQCRGVPSVVERNGVLYCSSGSRECTFYLESSRGKGS